MPQRKHIPHRPPADQDQDVCVHCGVGIYTDEQGRLRHKEVSDCCYVPMTVECGDDGDIGNTEGVTCHYECSLCNQPCTFYN